jgi:SAM-dependent methyltransferase
MALTRRTLSSQVSARWAGLASDEYVKGLNDLSWSGIPQVHLNHNFLITGSRTASWVEWIRDRYFTQGDAGDTLALGCGAGHLDRILKQCGYSFRSFTGIDISGPAVDRARVLAGEVNLAATVRYLAADLNSHRLPPGSFDFIYFFQSLHHIEALEHVLSQCRQALRPGGLLMVNEFVGPSRFQWTDAQIEAANRALVRLPEDLRRDRLAGGIKTKVDRPTVAQMVAHDPSEAVRSAEIEPLLKATFDVFAEWNWGGTVNHLVFQNIAGNFDPTSPVHERAVEQLIEEENALIRGKVLPSDFKVFLARRPGA